MLLNKSKLIFTFVLVATLISVFVCGIPYFNLPGLFDKNAINKGLDLSGGSLIVYEAQTEGLTLSADELNNNMEGVVVMMRNRLTNLGYTEATVTRVGENKVQIEIPEITDPEKAVQKLGSTAKLEFRDYKGNVILVGSDISRAQAGVDKETNQYAVFFELAGDAAIKKFSDATDIVKDYASGSNYIGIYLDEDEISKPTVSEKLTTGTLRIDNANFTADEVKWLAGVISAGALPFALKDIQLESIGPQLGENALESSLLAAGIGLVLVIIFMILVYRLLGVVSSLSLVIYTCIVGILIVMFRINLSLPGIAGIVLSIGMAVDANVVIYERINEEVGFGKSMSAAIKTGFSRAFTAILDSNITTIIAAVVLWIFGSGFIKGFAITLFIGVLVSFLTAVSITRFILNAFVHSKLSDTKYYVA
ncbi:MAG: protein translocase subunit SecD [Oscillospiraceae bacterium]|nr:protein translocase subunit SecD [Oscillospiraceae bacterium]